MMRKERLDKIVKLVNEEGDISVKTLSNRLSSAESTIRSDLNHLDKLGLIKRIHGGASSIEKKSNEYMYFENRLATAIQEKKYMAKLAMDFVENNDSIALDGSTTCYELAKLINASDLKLNIITNGIMVSQVFQNNPKIITTLIGGTISYESLSTSGTLGIELLDKININTYFFSSRALDQDGFTDFNLQEVLLKKAIIERSQKSIALVDHTKFDSKSLANICGVGEADYLITDKKINKDTFEKYKQISKNLIR